MKQTFAGKTVLVTGAGSGTGRATACAFAREGATVVAAGRRAEPLAHTLELVERDGGEGSMVTADVSRPDDVVGLVATTVSRHGGLDIAFNNAGTLDGTGPIADIDEDVWSNVVAVNLTGMWLSMKHEIAHMRASGSGVIVNMASSVGAHLRLPWLGAYAATKAAVSVLTRTAAREYIGEGIRINAVSPGPVDTSMSLLPGESEADRAERMRAALPIGRVADTAEIAAAVLWLASPDSSFAVGHDLVIDGGGTA